MLIRLAILGILKNCSISTEMHYLVVHKLTQWPELFLQVDVKMKKVSQSILFWCMLAAFVPCVISATLPPNSDGEKKYA